MQRKKINDASNINSNDNDNENQQQKIRVVSYDFDGMLADEFYIKMVNEIVKTNPNTPFSADDYRKLANAILTAEHHKFLFTKIDPPDITTPTILMIGSNRQDIFTDYANGTTKKSGSCFPVLENLSGLLGYEFDNTLYSGHITSDRFKDPFKVGKEIAETLNKVDLTSMTDYLSTNKRKIPTLQQHMQINNKIDNSSNDAQYQKTRNELAEKTRESRGKDCHVDKNKIALIYFQMQHIASKHPGKEIEFIFSDDVPEIISDLHQFFTKHPELIPAGVSLKLCLHNWSDVIENDPKNKGAIDMLRKVDGVGDHIEMDDRNNPIGHRTITLPPIESKASPTLKIDHITVLKIAHDKTEGAAIKPEVLLSTAKECQQLEHLRNLINDYILRHQNDLKPSTATKMQNMFHNSGNKNNIELLDSNGNKISIPVRDEVKAIFDLVNKPLRNQLDHGGRLRCQVSTVYKEIDEILKTNPSNKNLQNFFRRVERQLNGAKNGELEEILYKRSEASLGSKVN